MANEKIRIEISEQERLHLLEVSQGRTVTTGFGSAGLFLWVGDDSRWALEELAVYRNQGEGNEGQYSVR